MLKFENYSIETLKKYIPVIEKSPLNVNDVSTGSFFMWHEGVNLAFCTTEDGSFVSRQDVSGEVAFSYPFGGDIKAATEEILAYCRENDIPLKFYGVSDELLQTLKSNPNFDKISYAFDRKWSDYIYDFEEMRQFAGKKFGGQRNHIHKFDALYPTAEFSPLVKADLPKVREFLIAYHAEHSVANLEENDEFRHTVELAERFDELGLIGGKFTLDGKVISFTIGEIQGDTLIIHIEKALKSVTGAYPATFNSFVKYVGEHYNGLKFVNREDDSGDPGLRTSKLQYNPIKLVNKNIVKINSPYAGVEIPEITGEKVILSEIRDRRKHFLRYSEFRPRRRRFDKLCGTRQADGQVDRRNDNLQRHRKQKSRNGMQNCRGIRGARQRQRGFRAHRGFCRKSGLDADGKVL